MDVNVVTCTHIGVYKHAITKGKHYKVIEEKTDKFRVIGDHNKQVWIDKRYFVEDKADIPILKSWNLDDSVENYDLIETTLKFSNGTKRWCLLTTPEKLANHLSQSNLDPPGLHIKHLIILRTMNDVDIEEMLNYLDEQGELEQASLVLAG